MNSFSMLHYRIHVTQESDRFVATCEKIKDFRVHANSLVQLYKHVAEQLEDHVKQEKRYYDDKKRL